MDYASARATMVDSQLRTNKVTNQRLLDAFSAVPRELFVPESQRGIAYIDEDLPIGERRFLMEPMVLARLLQAAAVAPSDIVLEIGSGSGYAAAILARLAETVVALESDATQRERANATLGELGLDNVVVVDGGLTEGYPKQAPYNVILVSGAVDEIPPAISDQLAEDGRLATVLKAGSVMGHAVLMQRVGDVIASRVLFDAATPLLPEFRRDAGFQF